MPTSLSAFVNPCPLPIRTGFPRSSNSIKERKYLRVRPGTNRPDPHYVLPQSNAPVKLVAVAGSSSTSDFKEDTLPTDQSDMKSCNVCHRPSTLFRVARLSDMVQIQQLMSHKNLLQQDSHTLENYISRREVFVAVERSLNDRAVIVGALRFFSVPRGPARENLLRKLGIVRKIGEHEKGNLNLFGIPESRQSNSNVSLELRDGNRMPRNFDNMIMFYGGSLILKSKNTMTGLRLLAFACSQFPELVNGTMPGDVKDGRNFSQREDGATRVGLLFGCRPGDEFLNRYVMAGWLRHLRQVFGKEGEIERLHARHIREDGVEALGNLIIYSRK